MVQKIFAILMAILGAWIYQRFDSLFALIPIIVAVLMYRGADHGVWLYFDWDSDSDSSSTFGGSSDSGGDGGGD